MAKGKKNRAKGGDGDSLASIVEGGGGDPKGKALPTRIQNALGSAGDQAVGGSAADADGRPFPWMPVAIALAAAFVAWRFLSLSLLWALVVGALAFFLAWRFLVPREG